MEHVSKKVIWKKIKIHENFAENSSKIAKSRTTHEI